MKVLHFDSGGEFRRWLEANHSSVKELWVGFYNKGSGKGGITYLEALDEALCFGWIDGVRRKVDEERYTSRFTPRKARSNWSLVNVRNLERLIKDGRMREAGLLAFKARDEKSNSSERRPEELPGDLERVFRANRKAWAYWSVQPPGYRRALTWWVVSAAREETRRGRLERVIGASGEGRRLGLLTQK